MQPEAWVTEPVLGLSCSVYLRTHGMLNLDDRLQDCERLASQWKKSSSGMHVLHITSRQLLIHAGAAGRAWSSEQTERKQLNRQAEWKWKPYLYGLLWLRPRSLVARDSDFPNVFIFGSFYIELCDVPPLPSEVFACGNWSIHSATYPPTHLPEPYFACPIFKRSTIIGLSVIPLLVSDLDERSCRRGVD